MKKTHRRGQSWRLLCLQDRLCRGQASMDMFMQQLQPKASCPVTP